MATTVVKIGNCSLSDVDKFATLNLSPRAVKHVSAPLIPECFADLESKVIDTKLVTSRNLFVLEVVKAWIDPAQKQPKTIHHHGYGTFVVDGETIKIKSAKP